MLYVCVDMEMSPTYTDIHYKTMPPKNGRGVRSGKEKVYLKISYSSTVNVRAEHEREQAPPHNTRTFAAASG